MMSKIALTALAVASVALSAGAALARSPLEPDAAKPKRQCFWADNVTNFRAGDDRTVYLRVGVRDVYRLDMLTRCHDIDWTQKIGIRSRGTNHICSGLDAELVTPSPIGPSRCSVRSIEKLTPEQIAALPKSARP